MRSLSPSSSRKRHRQGSCEARCRASLRGLGVVPFAERCSGVDVSYMFDMSVGREMTYEKLGHGEVIDRHPDRSTPVVLGGVVKLITFAQTPQAVWTP
jgi:hypothetical protein